MSSQPTTSPQRQLVFGPFVFDESSGELHKHGVRVRLEGQPLQILATLIRQPGKVVARDEFQQQLWKGGTFVDFDHGLNAAMNRLRQALGIRPTSPATSKLWRAGGTGSLLPFRLAFRSPFW